MSLHEENIEPKKRWYQKFWGKIVATLAVFSTLGIILEGIIVGVNWYNHQQEMFKKVTTLETMMLDIINGDKQKDDKIVKLEDYVSSKNKSYAVGFRVFKDVDEETGKIIKTKKYRDWSGVWYNVHIDNSMSDYYGVDYYYYIDKDGEKIYCW